MTQVHPLLHHLLAAARGEFPPADGEVTLLPALEDGSSAVVAFTGHAMLATDASAADLVGLPLDGFGGAVAPETLLRLAQGRTIGVHDVTLVARGRGSGRLARTSAWDDHDRVRYATFWRDDVVVHGDDRGFVTLGTGLAGRREMSVEVLGPDHGRGAGRALIGEALALVPQEDFLFAAVSPGNARSLRAFLAQGFVPICSEVLIARPSREGAA